MWSIMLTLWVCQDRSTAQNLIVGVTQGWSLSPAISLSGRHLWETFWGLSKILQWKSSACSLHCNQNIYTASLHDTTGGVRHSPYTAYMEQWKTKLEHGVLVDGYNFIKLIIGGVGKNILDCKKRLKVSLKFESSFPLKQWPELKVEPGRSY